MAQNEPLDQAATSEAAESRTEVIASTLAALQARVADADRQALRGAIFFHPPIDPGLEPDGQGSR
jgi:hypothetical protein